MSKQFSSPNILVASKRFPALSERSVARFTALAQRAIGLPGEVNVLIADNRKLKSLNARFRHKHKPTDVLSFPATAPAEGLAGDLAISADFALSNARALGHSPVEELKILILHGVLHLAGYDHESDQGEMAHRERQLRQRFNLPDGLIERQDDVAPGSPKTTKSRKSHRQAK